MKQFYAEPNQIEQILRVLLDRAKSAITLCFCYVFAIVLLCVAKFRNGASRVCTESFDFVLFFIDDSLLAGKRCSVMSVHRQVCVDRCRFAMVWDWLHYELQAMFAKFHAQNHCRALNHKADSRKWRTFNVLLAA